MNIHAVLHGSRVNGPGLRSVIWTQGCGIQPKCAGCVNPQTWEFNVGREILPEDLAVEIIRDAAPGTEGITLSGGEPLEQAIPLRRFVCSIRARGPAWSIGMLTGYQAHELSEWGDSIISRLDWVVYGRYDRTQPTPGFVSSANQRLVLLTQRYTLKDFPAQMVECHIGPEGTVQVTGFPV